MELDTEVWLVDVHNTFVAAVVGVDEKLFPASGQCGSIDGETVVLRSDVALSGNHACARDIVATVTELHLLRCGARSAGEELVAQADTKDGSLVLLHDSRNVLNRLFEDSWVTRTIGDEQTIVLFTSGLCKIIVPGADEDLDTALEEASELVVFHADVDAQDTDGAAGWMLANDICGRLVELGGLDGDWKKSQRLISARQ